MVTLGLAEILVGTASEAGTMPAEGAMTKLGKTYKDSAKFSQEASEVKKSRKIPKLTFSIMDADIDALVKYVGGTKVNKSGSTKTRWAFDGSELVDNRAILVKTEQGLYFEMPNADIEAVVNADMSAKGIFLVEFTVTPLAVKDGKALRAYDPKEA